MLLVGIARLWARAVESTRVDRRAQSSHTPAMTQTRPSDAIARAEALEADGRLAEAAEALDAALASAPEDQSLLDVRARIALEREEDDAAELVRRSIAFRHDDPELQLQMILYAGMRTGPAIIPLLEDFVGRNPGSVEGQQRLADMLAEEGAGDRFDAAFVAALRDRPDDRALHIAYWETLASADRLDQALASIDSTKPRFADDRKALLMEVWIASHAGQIDRADALLERLGEGEDTLPARGKHWLQTGRLDGAVQLLEEGVRANPFDQARWALLSVAWRATGNPRHAWLCEQPGFWSNRDLGLSRIELTALADRLRTLHRSQTHPVGQSLRGGTQTAGNLFRRTEPEIQRLQAALGEAVQAHLTALPHLDRDHPLLRYLDKELEFGPGWSVRLTDGGFHVAHVHPAGMLSSACYISLPETMGSEDPLEGALELGRPPEALNVDLPPLATIRPEEGKLVLFPSYMFHGTRPFGKGERLTVAFDVVPRS